MKIKPLGDKVVLEPYSKEERTKSGIVLPDTVDKEKPEQGRVISVGPGKRDQNGKVVPMPVKKGDIVLFKKYSPDEIKVDRKEYLIIGAEDILGIVE